MGYLKIPNLYNDTTVLLFKQAYLLEKIEGTSAHIGWNGAKVSLFSGGASSPAFAELFDIAALTKLFQETFGDVKVTLYGEAYGGKIQKMSALYGKNLGFIGFDANIGGLWLNVPDAEDIFHKFGLEFVTWIISDTRQENLDKFRDAPSDLSIRRGIESGGMREGIVIRPLKEFTDNRGSRVIAKHKNPRFRETHANYEVGKPAPVISDTAAAIVDNWATAMRLRHVLDKLPGWEDEGMKLMPKLMEAMVNDIQAESVGEATGTVVFDRILRTELMRKVKTLYKAELEALVAAQAIVFNKD